jgi:hypothetical protein
MSFTISIQPLVNDEHIWVRIVCERGYRFLRFDADLLDSSYYMAHFTPVSDAARFDRLLNTGILFKSTGTARKFTAMVIANNMIMASDRRTVRNGRSVTGG